MTPARAAAVSMAALGVAQWLPAVTSIAPLRRTALPGLSGRSGRAHVALTYDDGPDPVSTPQFLALLERHGRVATFFLLGAYVEENADLVRHMVDRGHELGVHGWDHRCLAARRPSGLATELRRTVRVIEDVAGCTPRWYRPPYGVMTLEGLRAARQAHLTTVLWSAWGRDWTRKATPATITRPGHAPALPGRHRAPPRHRPHVCPRILARHPGGLLLVAGQLAGRRDERRPALRPLVKVGHPSPAAPNQPPTFSDIGCL